MTEPVSTTPFEGLGQHFMLSDSEGDAALVMAEYEAIADRIAADGCRRLLDWGCGFGYVAQFLRERGVEVVMYDYAHDADGTRKVPPTRFPGFTLTVSDDPIRLAYPDGDFDAVLSLGTLEHVSHPEHSLAEIHRVLVPGGRFYCYKLPNRHSWVEFAARKTGRYYHGKHEFDRVYTMHSARQMIAKNGFDVLDARYRNIVPLHQASRVVPKARIPLVRRVSDVVTAVPGFRRLSTNVELVAVRR